MRSIKSIIASTFILLVSGMLYSVAAQTVQVSPFNSVYVRNGGTVVLRHGSKQQVTLLRGTQTYSTIRTDDRGVLVVEKCTSRCPRGSVLEVEIVLPLVESLAVSDGGTVRTEGTFPKHQNLSLSVENGGVIDARAIIANNVSVSVREGGAVLTRPQFSMNASVFNGGVITYWGEAEVKSSVKGGGSISKGPMMHLTKPLSEFNTTLSSLPAVPPLPAVPRLRN